MPAPEYDISVIIPSRDRLWSLPRAVASCRSERLRMQIIVVDDGSVDGTAEWLQTQPDMTVVQGSGWGKPWGVNRALAAATGKYIRYLDSDDWLNPGANESQFEIGEREGADIVVSGLDLYSGDERIQRFDWQPTDDFIAQQLGESWGSHYSAFLFRRAFVADIPHRTMFPASDFASRDDRCLMLEVALRNPRIAVSSPPSLCHLFHERGRLQFNSGIRAFGSTVQTIYVYRQILGLLDRRGELTARRKRAAAMALWYAAHWLCYSHFQEGIRVAKWVADLDPAFIPPERGLLGYMYRSIGFGNTERILKLRRILLEPFRRAPRAGPAMAGGGNAGTAH